MVETERQELPPIDDNVRRDGGNPTEDETVPCEELDKAIKNAGERNTRDVPGS